MALAAFLLGIGEKEIVQSGLLNRLIGGPWCDV